MTKFTKGEWVYDDEECAISPIYDNELSICAIQPMDIENDSDDNPIWFYDEQTKANAHLIAAAPEMYDEIKRDIEELKQFIATLKEYSNDWLFYIAKLKRKESLLAKARGEK